ncbi:MAG: hypothetical protein KC478_04355 [Bacteriovoracaceae bacterium]|nr:hypothetical protein [Bacteriovoracaceae bacterium]
MVIDYLFKFEDGNELTFKLDTSIKRIPSDKEYPEWVQLGCHQCSNCPLKPEDSPLCPVAFELYELVDKNKDKLSYETARVEVKMEERSYFKDTDLQSGLFSLMGLLMANSECPHLKFLKPLQKFHLPFSSIEETLFRSSSAHLLKKYFDKKKDNSVVIDLNDLKESYRNLEIVNVSILERIRSISKGDANKNAIVALNIFAQMFSAEFDNDLEMIEDIFKND